MVIHRVPKVVDLLVYQAQVASLFSVKSFSSVVVLQFNGAQEYSTQIKVKCWLV